MKVLVACEFSGIVRDAFIARGHDAISCDLLPTERPGPHIQGDVLDVIAAGPFDLMVAFPPCTHLAVSGAAHFWRKGEQQDAALEFVRRLLAAPIPRIALENPVSVISTRIRKPDQVVHPWQFGHPEQKTTCLWLKNLPRLKSTSIVWDEMQALPRAQRERLHWLGPSADRGYERSRTFTGFAEAMAAQWGDVDAVQLEAFA